MALLNSLEKKFRQYGLIDISELSVDIEIDLKYSTTDNFTGKDLYGSLHRVYLVPEIAYMVTEAQRRLRHRYPHRSLLIYDAARPISIQRHMFELVKGTPQQKYVADPDHSGGGYHNYGVAVDLTISDHGVPLDMGCGFDCFDEISNVGNELQYIEQGTMSREAYENRMMLKHLMEGVGFEQNPDEWWHFQKYSKEELVRRFRLLDF